MKDKLMTALLGVAVAFFILTFSIGLPIYFRPFYYMQIEPLGVEEMSGYTKEEIIDAYDEMLDYCTLPWAKFGTGNMKYSEDGASHFADCKGLFILNGSVLLASSLLLIALIIMIKKRVFIPRDPLGFNVTFFSGVGLLGTISLIAGLAATDFGRAFEIFHKVMFPGKDNWLFDPRTDEIILALPIDFFMSCAVMIAVSMILLSGACIAFGIITKVKRKKM